MLELVIQGGTMFNEEDETFIDCPSTRLKLEHSLLAIAKWESKWNVSFMEQMNPTKQGLTNEQMLDYIKCMSIKPVSDDTIMLLNKSHYDMINDYLSSKQTATTITEAPGPPGKKQIWTAELFYYSMFANQIPIECEKWNINRLIMLIKIFSIKNAEQDPKNKNKQVVNKDFYAEREALNARRRQQYNSKG